MDLKFIKVNQMVNNYSFQKNFFFFISIKNLYLLADLLGRRGIRQLDEFDSEDESEIRDDLYKKDFLPRSFSSSSLMIPEQ